MGVTDDLIVAEIHGPEHVAQKLAALHAHRTQIADNSWFFRAADTIDDFWASEHFRFASGTPFPQSDKWADDLFAGLV
jgi:N-acetyl-1-D-myo-inositol-2-amino-2-deoxy-alpha-D-glucopyranoside deacetylase